jgi:hypothetical protein
MPINRHSHTLKRGFIMKNKTVIEFVRELTNKKCYIRIVCGKCGFFADNKSFLKNPHFFDEWAIVGLNYRFNFGSNTYTYILTVRKSDKRIAMFNS